MISDEYDLLHKKLIETQIIKSCLNCDHFQFSKERTCHLYDVEPPPEVIVFACPSWVPHIPF